MTYRAELVVRLRTREKEIRYPKPTLYTEAADEIERLREVLARIAAGATGHADRDAELAVWARQALGD